ncbi:hypothetical protein KQX54_015201, partial [Cotesia glomerata]
MPPSLPLRSRKKGTVTVTVSQSELQEEQRGWDERERERESGREEEYRHCLLRVRIETKACGFCNGFEFGWFMCALSACSSIPLYTHVYGLETSVHNTCPRVD